MITLFFLSILVVFIYTPFGYIIYYEYEKKEKSILNYSYFLIYSGILISFIALILNFFTSLNFTINSLLILISLFIILKNKDIFVSKKYIFFSTSAALIIFLLLSQSHTYRPDSGLYHFPYINILNTEKIIFGLSNLHFRYGHISIIQYYSAILNNHIFSSNGMAFSSALIYAGVILNFLSQIKNYTFNKNFGYHFIFLVAVSIYIISKMNRYGEFGNDAPSHLMFFFLISEFLALIGKKNYTKKINNLFLISIYIILNKLTLLFSIFIPVILVNKKNIKKIIVSRKNIFTMVFLFAWLMKNLIVSGCLFFPVATTCFDTLKWTDINEVNIVSNENEAWSKGWYNYNKSKEISHKDYIKNFKWIPHWSSSTGKQILKIIVFYIIALLIIFYLIFKFKFKNNYKIDKKIIFLQAILILATIFWFIKIPVYRYGTSYLISLISIFFAIYLQNFKIKKNIQPIITIIFISSFCIFISKNIYRIIINDKTYYNYPWPKNYSHGDKNIIKVPEKIKINGKIFYVAKNSYCMYGYSPCSQKNLEDIDLTKKNSYFLLTKKSVKK